MSKVLKEAAYFEEKKVVLPKNCPFLNSIDEALSVLGDSAREAVYFYLESDHDLAKEMIPIRAQVFEDAMEMMFKDGAKMILRLVVKKSYIKAGLEPPPQTYHISSLQKIGRKSSKACWLRENKCHLRKCVYFDGERIK